MDKALEPHCFKVIFHLRNSIPVIRLKVIIYSYVIGWNLLPMLVNHSPMQKSDTPTMNESSLVLCRLSSTSITSPLLTRWMSFLITNPYTHSLQVNHWSSAVWEWLDCYWKLLTGMWHSTIRMDPPCMSLMPSPDYPVITKNMGINMRWRASTWW